MSETHITQIDLNLLVALDALLQERSVTRAADRLGMSQPAASRTLGRLRRTFGDPLFTRTSRGLTPTQRALELAGPLRAALLGLEGVLRDQPHFDPRVARRRYRIAIVDYALVTLLGELLARLAREGPSLDFELRQPLLESERELESGALDLLVMPQQKSGAGIVWTPLYDDAYTCVVWRGHPHRRLTLARFAAMEHVLVAPSERPGGVVDEVLAEHGLARRIAVQVSTFLGLPYVLAGTERVATVPRRMATELARRHPLRVVAAPVPIPGFTMALGWHEIHRNDPGHRWLRGRVAEAAAALRARR
jgi:DNA-binding transcriptional LysR family regulator